MVQPAACTLINESEEGSADDAVDRPARGVLLMTPPAVNTLRINHNKDFVSHGAKGSLLQTRAQLQATHARAFPYPFIFVPKHTPVELARFGPGGIDPPEFIAAC